jgi:biopolymer transport protein ExbD
VALLRDGSTMLDKKPIQTVDLPAQLKALHEKDGKRKVNLKADVAVPYKRVRETFATIQGVGFHGLALRVAKQDGKPGES